MMNVSENLDCFADKPQHFLISVFVHQAKNLIAFNVNTFVIVKFEKKKKSTKICRKTDSPHYNEFFVFEDYCAIKELLQKNISFEIHKVVPCRLEKSIGEIVITLANVWNEPDHSFIEKWIPLENPINSIGIDKERGHLLLDLVIVTQNKPPTSGVYYSENYGTVGDEISLPPRIGQKVKYFINFYQGFFTQENFYTVQVTLGKFSLKINQSEERSSRPIWNQQLSFLWFYPSLCDNIQIKVLFYKHLKWKTLCSCQINFHNISNNINQYAQLPSFGPTYYHFYHGNKYLGRILFSVDSFLTDNFIPIDRKLGLNGIPPLSESNYWQMQNFHIFFGILDLDFIHITSSEIRIEIICGEYQSNELLMHLLKYKSTPLKYLKFNTKCPYIYISLPLPDVRQKFHNDILIDILHEELKINLNNFVKSTNDINFDKETTLQILNETKNRLKICKNKIQLDVLKELTLWEKNRRFFLEEFFKNVIEDLEKFCDLFKSKKHILEKIQKAQNFLRELLDKLEFLYNSNMQNKWPDLIINVKFGDKIIGYYRTDPRKFTFSHISAMGKLCSKRHNIVFKPPSCNHSCSLCGCIFGKADILLWIGSSSETSNWLLDGWGDISNHCVMQSYTKCRMKFYLYLYQAKIQAGFDRSGLCDARVYLSVHGTEGSSSVCYNTLTPIWNETLIIEGLSMLGSALIYKNNPPLIILKLFDEDKEEKSEDFIGHVVLQPTVALQSYHRLQEQTECSQSKDLPPLKWVSIVRNGNVTGEVLLSAEFVEVLNGESQQRLFKCTNSIPTEIRPKNILFRLEVSFIGLRSMEKLTKNGYGKYKVELTFGSFIRESSLTGNKLGASVNFTDVLIIQHLELPEQLEYWPPIILHLIDCSKKKSKIIGAVMISNSKQFLVNDNRRMPKKIKDDNDFITIAETVLKIQPDGDETETEETDEKSPLINNINVKNYFHYFNNNVKKIKKKLTYVKLEERNDQRELQKEDSFYNWWTKFYNSLNEDNFHEEKHRLKIYNSELENQPEFRHFHDWATAVEFVRGKNHKKGQMAEGESFCILKANIQIRHHKYIPEDIKVNMMDSYTILNQQVMPFIEEKLIFVYVYIVRGLKLRTRDIYSYSDPYIKLEYGAQTISDRDNFIQNQANPLFGRSFKLEGLIPRDDILKISIYDRDLIRSCDDLIGTTFIDIEDRFRSRHRAFCGIANEYNQFGYNMWRNIKSPREILKDLCDQHYLPPPFQLDNTIYVDGHKFNDTTILSKSENLTERLSLSVLKELKNIPSIDYSLVPEHVETRSLYRNDHPGLEQGKLQMWIEICERDKAHPLIDITPEQPVSFELRIIVWNTADVKLDEKDIFGILMSDIYVKCWLDNIYDAQKTDIHFRSLNGTGNFNWRMIFKLQYSVSEDMMISVKKKNMFEKFDTEIKMSPILNVQIWDNDLLSADDFLGATTINLSNFSTPATRASKCDLNRKTTSSIVNLFKRDKSIKGWFPVRGKLENGSIGVTGKIELELQAVVEEIAILQSVGKGRDPPEPLPKPSRPKSSFNWFKNPWDSFKFILLPHVSKLCPYYCVIILIIIIILTIIFHFL